MDDALHSKIHPVPVDFLDPEKFLFQVMPIVTSRIEVVGEICHNEQKEIGTHRAPSSGPVSGHSGAIAGPFHLSGRIDPGRGATGRCRESPCDGVLGLFAENLFNRSGEAGDIANDERAIVPLDQADALDSV